MVVATPLSFVVPLGGVKVPPPEATKNDTLASGTRLLLPSRAVTVMVARPSDPVVARTAPHRSSAPDTGVPSWCTTTGLAIAC